MKDHAGNVPRVAFVVNLAQPDAPQLNLARLRHMAHLFRGHRVAATWALADASQARLLGDSSTVGNIALTVNDDWAATGFSQIRFRNELGSRLAGLANATRSAPTLVVGALGGLRTRATALAEQGIRAVFVSDPTSTDSTSPRPLPCGLWQLVPSVRWPRRRLLRWLPTRSVSVKDLLASSSEGVILVGIEATSLQKVSARGLQCFEKLLREVSWSASREQLQIVTVSEIVADLVSRREVKPQRSILRAALNRLALFTKCAETGVPEDQRGDERS